MHKNSDFAYGAFDEHNITVDPDGILSRRFALTATIGVLRNDSAGARRELDIGDPVNNVDYHAVKVCTSAADGGCLSCKRVVHDFDLVLRVVRLLICFFMRCSVFGYTALSKGWRRCIPERCTLPKINACALTEARWVCSVLSSGRCGVAPRYDWDVLPGPAHREPAQPVPPGILS